MNTKTVSSSRSLKIKSTVKAGAALANHNQVKARLVIKSAIKAGGLKQNHSATQVRAR
jgi:hypothetical protein